MLKKPSFLERLTGSVKLDTDHAGDFDEDVNISNGAMMENDLTSPEQSKGEWQENPDDGADGELPIDMFPTRDAIIIRALVAGVDPEDLDISITRDMVTLKGKRQEMQEAPDEDYYHRELFWGTFSRTILLPEEIIIDEAEAKEKHGLLEIVLPKLDKERSARLTVRSHHPTK